jgi:hypothetical protein
MKFLHHKRGILPEAYRMDEKAGGVIRWSPKGEAREERR